MFMFVIDTFFFFQLRAINAFSSSYIYLLLLVLLVRYWYIVHTYESRRRFDSPLLIFFVDLSDDDTSNMYIDVRKSICAGTRVCCIEATSTYYYINKYT